MKETWLNNLFGSRGIFVVIAIAAAFLAAGEYHTYIPQPAEYTGILGITALPPAIYGLTGAVANFALLLIISLYMLLLDRRFQFLGGMSSLYATLFIAFSMAIPQVCLQPCTGIAIALILLLCTHYLFSLYDEPQARTRIYLIFTILSALSMVTTVTIYAIPLFIVGVVQMRAMNIKGALAAIGGIITPYWITIGTGFISIEALEFPLPLSIWALWGNLPAYLLCVAAIILLAFGSIGINMMHLLKQRLRTRAYNGFIIISLLWTALMIVVDCGSAIAYIPMLCVCAAMQISHLYSASNNRRRYISVIIILLLASAANFMLTTNFTL